MNASRAGRRPAARSSAVRRSLVSRTSGSPSGSESTQHAPRSITSRQRATSRTTCSMLTVTSASGSGSGTTRSRAAASMAATHSSERNCTRCIVARDDCPVAPRPADEHPHEPGGDGWSETWSFDRKSADGDLGGWVAFTRFADHAWYHAMLAGPRRQLLAVLDHHVPFRSHPLEVRTTGLWADHV